MTGHPFAARSPARSQYTSAGGDKYKPPGNPVAHWIAEDGSLITFTNGLVTGYADRTGNGHDWGQVATREPRREIKQGRASLRCIAVHPGDWLSQAWDPVGGHSNWTITGWFNTTNTTGNVGVLSNYDFAGGGFAINTNGNALMFRFMDGATHKWCTLGGVVSDGTWHHYALRFDGTQPVGSRLTWMVDGVAQTVGGDVNDVPTAIAASVNPLLFGRYANSPNADLYFAETLIYHESISSSVVTELHNRGPWYPTSIRYMRDDPVNTNFYTFWSGSVVSGWVDEASGDWLTVGSGNGPSLITHASGENVLEFINSSGADYLEGDTDTTGRLSTNEFTIFAVTQRLGGYAQEQGLMWTIVPVGLFPDYTRHVHFNTRDVASSDASLQFSGYDTNSYVGFGPADYSDQLYVWMATRHSDGTQKIHINGGAPLVTASRSSTLILEAAKYAIGKYPTQTNGSSCILAPFHVHDLGSNNIDADGIGTDLAARFGITWTPLS